MAYLGTAYFGRRYFGAASINATASPTTAVATTSHLATNNLQGNLACAAATSVARISAGYRGTARRIAGRAVAADIVGQTSNARVDGRNADLAAFAGHAGKAQGSRRAG